MARTRPRHRAWIGRSTLIVVAVLTAAACGGDATETPTSSDPAAVSTAATPSLAVGPTRVGGLTITSAGCSLEIEGPVSAGSVEFVGKNETDVLAAFNIAVLDEGATFAAFEAHIRKEVRLAEAGKPGLGHPGFAVPLFDVLLQPGESGTLSGTLDPGSYGSRVPGCSTRSATSGRSRPSVRCGSRRRITGRLRSRLAVPPGETGVNLLKSRVACPPRAASTG